MEYQYNIAGHLCRIVFCDAGNDSSLLPSFSPFESEEEGNLLFCLSVDDAFRWPVTGEEVGQFDCGGNNFGVYRLPDGSYQFEGLYLDGYIDRKIRFLARDDEILKVE